MSVTEQKMRLLRYSTVVSSEPSRKLLKKNQSWAVVRGVKTDFIQDDSNRGNETSAWNWGQVQI